MKNDPVIFKRDFIIADNDPRMTKHLRGFIRPKQVYESMLREHPQQMTVRTVSATHIHFTRKGVSGMFIMPIARFAEIAVAPKVVLKKAGKR